MQCLLRGYECALTPSTPGSLHRPGILRCEFHAPTQARTPIETTPVQAAATDCAHFLKCLFAGRPWSRCCRVRMRELDGCGVACVFVNEESRRFYSRHVEHLNSISSDRRVVR